MASETDRVRQDIEISRARLARDVDQIVERAAPRQLAHRGVDRLRDGVRTVRDRVMGASEDTTSAVAHAASQAGDAARSAEKKLARTTQGSPVAVAMIAFGTGLLAAALVPESDAERRAAQHLADNLGPMAEPLQEAGRALAADVMGSARSAAAEVRSAAVDAATQVGAAAATEAGNIRTTAADAASHTLHDAADRGRALLDQSRDRLDG